MTCHLRGQPVCLGATRAQARNLGLNPGCAQTAHQSFLAAFCLCFQCPCPGWPLHGSQWHSPFPFEGKGTYPPNAPNHPPTQPPRPAPPTALQNLTLLITARRTSAPPHLPRYSGSANHPSCQSSIAWAAALSAADRNQVLRDGQSMRSA